MIARIQERLGIPIEDIQVQWFSGCTMESNVTRQKKKPKADKNMPRGRVDKGTKADAEVSGNAPRLHSPQ